MDVFVEVEQLIEFSPMPGHSINKLVLNTSHIRTIKCRDDGKAIIELDTRTIITNEIYEELCKLVKLN